MLERFIDKTTFESQEDFIKNFKIKVPENFNFGYDVVDVGRRKNLIRKRYVGQTIMESILILRLPT